MTGAVDCPRRPTPRVGLVLSGGFLRGAFQVGVVEALDAAGIRFDLAVGVSSGAWNAACVAAGQIGEMRRFWMEVAAAPKLSLASLWRYGTPLNYRAIMDAIPARGVRFDRLSRGPVRLIVGVTRLRDWSFRLFDSAEGPLDYLRILTASSHVPGLDGVPIRIDGRWYADGGLIDNVPYEPALHAGCERVYVVVPSADGALRKRFCGPLHRVQPRVRRRMIVVHPLRPLRLGWLSATPEALGECIESGREAVARMMACGGCA